MNDEDLARELAVLHADTTAAVDAAAPGPTAARRRHEHAERPRERHVGQPLEHDLARHRGPRQTSAVRGRAPGRVPPMGRRSTPELETLNGALWLP